MQRGRRAAQFRASTRQGALGPTSAPGAARLEEAEPREPGKMAPSALLRPFWKLLAPARFPSVCKCPSSSRPARASSLPLPGWAQPCEGRRGLRPGVSRSDLRRPSSRSPRLPPSATLGSSSPAAHPPPSATELWVCARGLKSPSSCRRGEGEPFRGRFRVVWGFAKARVEGLKASWTTEAQGELLDLSEPLRGCSNEEVEGGVKCHSMHLNVRFIPTRR